MRYFVIIRPPLDLGVSKFHNGEMANEAPEGIVSATTLERALKRIDKEITTTQQSLVDLKRKRAALLVLLDRGDESPSPEQTSSESQRAAKQTNLTPRSEVVKAIVGHLKDGSPKSTGELVDLLSGSGIVLGEKRPDVRVWTFLKNQAETFERTGEKLWKLK